MGIPIGTSLYGHVDHMPGVGSVATKFFHIAYLPLFPLESWFVLEGTDDGNSFRGVPIPTSGTSVLMGLVHGWLLVPAYAGFMYGLFTGLDGDYGIVAALAMSGCLALLGAVPYLGIMLGSASVLRASKERMIELLEHIGVTANEPATDTDWG